MTPDILLQKAKDVMTIEANSVARASSRLGASFPDTLKLMQKAMASGNKLVFSGIGKSHYIASKLVASFLSTGVNAVFVHPSEALHGDLGAISPGDICFLFSKSGATAEILGLLPFLKGRNPIIAITGDLDSPLAKQADFVLDASVEQEACPINMVPTASTTVALAIGDALVSVFADLRGFTREKFANIHPGGSIGKRLNFSVSQVCVAAKNVAQGKASTLIRHVAVEMSSKPLGAFCVLNSEDKVEGIITEGDLRRLIAKGTDIASLTAADVMTKTFVSVSMTMSLADALEKMEQKSKQVSCAPVLDDQKRLLGLVRLHDML